MAPNQAVGLARGFGITPTRWDVARHHWGVGVAVALGVAVLVSGCREGTAQVDKTVPAPPPGPTPKTDVVPDPPAAAAPVAGPPAESFVICYNPAAPVKELAHYDVIVVDSAYPPARVAELTGQGKTVLGYLSLGKVHGGRAFVADVRAKKIGLVPDQQYPDSFRVDVSDANWQKLVTGTIIPGMKKAGFSGLFLDDLDDIGRRRMEAAGVALIAAIRQAHPGLRLMANRGLEYLPKFAKDVDDSLLESCFALDGKLRPPGDPAWALGHLKAGRAVNPKLTGFAVDYYDTKGGRPPTPAQQQLIAAVRARHAENGLRSCVTTQDLQFLPPRSLHHGVSPRPPPTPRPTAEGAVGSREFRPGSARGFVLSGSRQGGFPTGRGGGRRRGADRVS